MSSQSTSPGAPDARSLTPREHEVLALLAVGHATADVAAQLGITAGTVKTHLTSVYRKLGVKNRVQAARYYIELHNARPRE